MEPVAKISGGFNNSGALNEKGSLWCWGDGRNGKCLEGTTKKMFMTPTEKKFEIFAEPHSGLLQLKKPMGSGGNAFQSAM